jgi:hemolysin activation/secretion protein
MSIVRDYLRPTLLGGGLVFALAGVLATPLSAQTASQVTPPTFRPSHSTFGGSVVFSGRAGLDAPAGADRLFVTLSGVSVEGTLPPLAAETEAFRARVTGRRIPASEIFVAARELEAAYVRAGFVLVRVVLPAQSLKDGGRLRVVVVDGFIERIDARALPESARSRVLAVLQPLVGQRGLTLPLIERKLLLAGDTPGLALRSTLSPGNETGGALLVLDGRFRSVDGFVGIDNTYSSLLGRTNLTTGLDVNSPFGFGEVFYGRASGHPGGDGPNDVGSLFGQYPRLRVLAAGAVVPLGTDGLSLNFEVTDSRTTPKPQAGFQTATEFQRFSTRLRYPWIRTRAFTWSSDLVFDVEEAKNDALFPLLTLPISLDRLRVLRAATDAVWQLPVGGGAVSGRAVASFGINGLGARSAADASIFVPLSRLGADADFTKVEAQVNYVQPIVDHVGFAFLARAQTSFNTPLPQAEQIGIANFQELSTFDTGTLGGDSGWVVRGELNSPWLLPVAGYPISITPYAFAATGALYLARPTFYEQSTTHVSSIGLGVRLVASPDGGTTQGSLTLEYGRRFRDDNQPDANRFSLVGNVRF